MDAALVAASASLITTVISAGPAYIGLSRRLRGAAAEEGELTREAVCEAVTSLGTRIDAVRDELRSDIREVREWQASHTAEHLVLDHETRRRRNDE